MRLQTVVLVALLGLAAVGFVAAQAPFKEYPGIEYDHVPVPTDWQQKTEWTRARLRYPDIYGYPNRMLMMGDGREFPGYWTMDYPRSDRHLLQGVRRLTRIDARSVEQVVSLDGTNEVYNWPVMYAVEVGHWRLPDEQAQQLREYLLRGGFLMVDDFHTDGEWRLFEASLRKVFPERSISRAATLTRRATRTSTTTSTPARPRTGAPSTMTAGASWWPSATTWTSATPGNTRTKPNTKSNGPHSHTALR